MNDYVVWTIDHLFWWVLMLSAALGLGNTILGRARFESAIERVVFSTAVGLGLWGLGLFLLGLCGLLYQPAIIALTVVAAIATIGRFLFRNRRSLMYAQADLPGIWRRVSVTPRGIGISAMIAVGVAYWILLLIVTQYPPFQWDAISTHLILSRSYLSEHRIVVDTGNIYPVLPALNHMLFTWALALKDDILAQMVSHSFFMLTALGLVMWGRRTSRPFVGVTAAAFWLAHPVVIWLSAAAYVDMGVTCLVFLGVYAMRVAWDGKSRSWWYLSLALLSMAAGTKLPGLFFLAGACLLGFFLFLRFLYALRFRNAVDDSGEGRPSSSDLDLKGLVRGAALVIAVAGPWYAFIAYETGNPLWPTFLHLSKDTWVTASLVEYVEVWQGETEPLTIGNFIKLPFDWVRYPQRFFGEMNLTLLPLIAVWPLAWIISLFNRSVRWWTLWALAFTLFWFFHAQQIRYWLPALPLAGLALFESIQWCLAKLTRRVVVHTTILTAAFLVITGWGSTFVVRHIREMGIPPATAEARQDFLGRLGGFDGLQYINARAKPDDNVCVVGVSWLNYYLKTEFTDMMAYLQLHRRPAFSWPADEEWIQWLDSHNTKWIILDRRNGYFQVPSGNPMTNPFWPDYQLVYADHFVWVFRRKPVPPDITRNDSSREPETDRTVGTKICNNGPPGSRITYGGLAASNLVATLW